MNVASVLLYPVLLLLPAAGMVDGNGGRNEDELPVSAAPADASGDAHVWPEMVQVGPGVNWPLAAETLLRVRPQDAWQVRIEQRMTIRIAPRGAAPIAPEMFVGIPDSDTGPRFTERKIGKCIAVGAIAGVQPDRANRLLLFMRDHRLVSAELERSCRARDFYSGFYLARSQDGQICVDRDTLLSRSGMNCKLTRIRQLVEIDR